MPLAFIDMTSRNPQPSDRRQARPSFNAGVVAGAIKPAKTAHSACDQGFDFRCFRYVRFDKNGVTTFLLDESSRFASAIAVEIGYNDLGAFLEKFKRGSTADPSSRASHQRYLSRHEAHLDSAAINGGALFKIIQPSGIVRQNALSQFSKTNRRHEIVDQRFVAKITISSEYVATELLLVRRRVGPIAAPNAATGATARVAPASQDPVWWPEGWCSRGRVPTV